MSPETERALAVQRQQMQASLGEVIRQAKADAWDEGHSWGWSDAQEAQTAGAKVRRIDWPLCTINPYREEASDAPSV